MLHELFLLRDMNGIVSIPLFLIAHADKCIWHFSKNGEYTAFLTNNTRLHVLEEWNKLWQLRLPPKIKNFAWRVVREVLPNRITLRNRGIDVQTDCTFCPNLVENSWNFLCVVYVCAKLLATFWLGCDS